MDDDSPKRRFTLSGRRDSKAGSASDRDQRDRIRNMTARERMELALALGRRHAELMRRRESPKDGA